MSAVAVAAREFEFTDRDFETISAILHHDSGIALPAGKSALVYSRLGKRLRALGLTRFSDYCALVSSAEGGEERAALLSALTTNVTRFFREPHHFDTLRQQVRDRLAPRARAGGRVRLWSAGCSLGHEPYSIALTLAAELPEAASLDVRILATDIDPKVIEVARAGRYGREDVQSVPPALAAGVTTSGAEAVMSPAIRSLITFGTLNLHADWPMKGRFDAIFCRNVAIYFDEPTQKRLWSRFASALQDDGRLYIGHSERADTPMLSPDGLTTYRKTAS